MQTRLITTEKELLSLREQWNELIEGNPKTDFPFFSWEWFYYSWQYAGSPEIFVVLTMENEKIVGILPLIKTQVKKRGIPFRQLSFCPNGNTPRNSLYVSSTKTESESEVINAIFERLHSEKKHWDMIALTNIEQSTPLHTVLSQAKENPIYRFVIQEPGRVSPYIAIRDYASFDDYMLKIVSTRRRTKMRRDMKRLDETNKPWAIKHYESSERMIDGVQDMWSVIEKSWKAAPSSKFMAFFENVCRDPYLSRFVRIDILYLEDAPIASQFYLIKNGLSFMCLNDHDSQYRNSIIPGSNLTTLMLKYAFENRWSEFSFSGESYEYKTRLASSVDFSFSISDIQRWRKIAFDLLG